jgi:hypothetical protein
VAISVLLLALTMAGVIFQHRLRHAHIAARPARHGQGMDMRTLVRDGRPQRGGPLRCACIERLSPPLREDYAERIAGSWTQALQPWQEALVAWNRDQFTREVSYQGRPLDAGESTQPPTPAARRPGPKPKPLTTEQRDLVRRARRYRSLHQAAKNLNSPYTTLRGWNLRYEREVLLGLRT